VEILTRRSEECGDEELPTQGFLAEFTLSQQQILRFAQNDKAKGSE